ncbi:hypothetical protein POSPLADRAFT_1074896 [Postia placenta MAD-698-R-SB12]|uniref:NADH:flavin oxidoreductase/NADH oxidase N-terminal domain-containing protein n=1 Tax=Postia placenta MAD-698-R-SB12 TaxID=670580 RepID=A0A1X6MY49_9APHY|nr:hypothetical protein POSPLADRAFT_1074896 [Postia placenta MAD-698-R-SB12]OSX61301.1 hypothetical protein POSPLADRAFT_1074896 [Postia placenta MAD-698-R-SB12]
MAHNNNVVNAPAPGIGYFTPAQNPPAGTALDPQPDGKPIPKLFQPLKIRGVEFQNRIWLSPLCQYSAEDGKVTAWQLAHLGGIFTRGPGLSVVEATAVVPEGRITPQDAGIWSDEHIEPWRKIVEFAHSQGQKIGIQLAHAGRKASTVAPWLDFHLSAPEIDGGWPNDVYGPSALAYDENFAQPKELTKADINRVVRAFADGARRSLRAGFDVIEIHSAHGYLLSEFLAPSANKRTDEYGGSFENRIRVLVEVVDAIRAVIPPTMPLFVRLTAADWLHAVLPNESWTVEDTVRLTPILAEHGVDVLDVSSGGIDPRQQFSLAALLDHDDKERKTAGLFQVPLARAVKQAHGSKIFVSAVGGITNGHLAQAVLDEDSADVVFVGRFFQKNPGLVWSFAEDLGVAIRQARQIEWGFTGRAVGQKATTSTKA